MAALELSPELRKAGQQTGEPGRNPTGKQGDTRLRKFWSDVRSLMRKDDFEMCDLEGYQHLTWSEAIHESLRRDCVAGPDGVRTRARQHYYNRRWGRQAYEVTVEQRVRQDLHHMSAEELFDHTHRVKNQIFEMIPQPVERPQIPEPPEAPVDPPEAPERDDDREPEEQSA